MSRVELLPAAMNPRAGLRLGVEPNALLFAATQDRLHQPYRASLMQPSSALIAQIRSHGFAATVSGAGPCVLVLHHGDAREAIEQIAAEAAGIRPLACAASADRHQGCGGGTRMSIPLILASQSRPRRDVLFSAGICPTIRVSHVDEPAALEREAAALGVTVNDLSVEQRVMILAAAKAEAVHQAYRNVADTAAHARGERVVGYPLRQQTIATHPRRAQPHAGKRAVLFDEIATTRDFSGIDIPTVAEPIADFVDAGRRA